MTRTPDILNGAASALAPKVDDRRASDADGASGQSHPQSESEVQALTEQVRVMGDRLNDDFINARVGKRQKMYEHRSRVLRQLKARLGALRVASGSASGTS